MEMSSLTWNMEMSFFGMPVYILGVCPENRDESNGDSIVKLSLQFIPIFEALHSQLRKGHTTKKDIPMFLICILSAISMELSAFSKNLMISKALADCFRKS
jgi:hypothetical protein